MKHIKKYESIAITTILTGQFLVYSLLTVICYNLIF